MYTCIHILNCMYTYFVINALTREFDFAYRIIFETIETRVLNILIAWLLIIR